MFLFVFRIIVCVLYSNFLTCTDAIKPKSEAILTREWRRINALVLRSKKQGKEEVVPVHTLEQPNKKTKIRKFYCLFVFMYMLMHLF